MSSQITGAFTVDEGVEMAPQSPLGSKFHVGGTCFSESSIFGDGTSFLAENTLDRNSEVSFLESKRSLLIQPYQKHSVGLFV